MRALLPIVLLAACGPASTDPCDAMCDAGAALYGSCLEEWGVEWESAGYADESAWLESCQTWAWEMRLLEEDAVDAGLATAGSTDQTCEARAQSWTEPATTCAEYTAVDWSLTPWEAP